MVNAVLFDYGLTLVTFEYPHAELKAAMEEVRPWLPEPAPDADTIMREVLLPLEDRLDGAGEAEVDYMDLYEDQWRRAGFDLPRELLARILDREQRVWDRAARLAPDALSTLRALRERGLRTGLASNAPFPPDLLHRQLAAVGVAPLLDAAVFSSEVGRRKPAPALYEAALDRLGVEATATLHVGDRVDWDYEAPRALGMEAVICTAFARDPVPDGVPTIPNLAALLELV